MTRENPEPQAIAFWAAGNAVSQPLWLASCDVSTIVAPSALNGQSVNVTTALDDELREGLNEPEQFDGVPLLATPKALVTGDNPFRDDEMRALCAAGRVQLVLSSAPTVDCEAWFC